MPADGDLVSCELTSNVLCPDQAVVSSNNVFMSITEVIHPALVISANPGDQLIYGQQVVFSAAVSGTDNSGYQIRWYRNGNFMSGATGDTWTATAGADITNNSQVSARLHSFSSCAIPDSAWSNVIKVLVGTTGIEATGAPAGFSVYPNPGRSLIHIEGLYRGVQFVVYNATGKLVLERNIVQSGSHQVDISGFAQGVYLFSFTDNSGSRWQIRVVKN
jgi:hypothetical protein